MLILYKLMQQQKIMKDLEISAIIELNSSVELNEKEAVFIRERIIHELSIFVENMDLEKYSLKLQNPYLIGIHFEFEP